MAFYFLSQIGYTTTLLFKARLFSESFGTVGSSAPKYSICKREGEMPRFTKYLAIATVRFKDKKVG